MIWQGVHSISCETVVMKKGFWVMDKTPIDEY